MSLGELGTKKGPPPVKSNRNNHKKSCTVRRTARAFASLPEFVTPPSVPWWRFFASEPEPGEIQICCVLFCAIKLKLTYSNRNRAFKESLARCCWMWSGVRRKKHVWTGHHLSLTYDLSEYICIRSVN